MLHVRPATPGDLDTIVLGNMKLAEESENVRLDETTLRPGITALLEGRAPGVYWVAELDGQVVGQLLITYEWSDWRNNWFWWIQSVYILPEFRGRSIYRAMYAFVKQLAEKRGGVCGFRLYVEKENVHAQKVYEQLGMHESHYLAYEEEV